MKKTILIIIFLFLISGINNFIYAQEMTDRRKSEKKELVYSADNFRDPFMPQIGKGSSESDRATSYGSTEETKFPDLKVQGMVWNSDMPQAIINNQVFNVGDEIEGAKIVEINKNGVRLIFKTKSYELKPTISVGKKK